MKPIVLLLLVIMLASVASAQEPANSVPDTTEKAFNYVERIGEDNFRSFYMFSVGGHEYTIRADGRGERSFEKARSRNFTLKVDQGHIEQVYFLEHEGDLLLIYQLSSRQSVRGYVVRLNQTNLRTIWLRLANGLNPETAVVKGGYLTLTAEHGVMKLDLRSGAFLED